MKYTYLLFVLLLPHFLFSDDIFEGDIFDPHCEGFHSQGGGQGLESAHELIKKIFEYSNAENREEYLLNFKDERLKSKLGRMAADWRFVCLRINYWESYDGLAAMCWVYTTQEKNKTRMVKGAPLFFTRKSQSEDWKLYNFPFHSSGISHYFGILWPNYIQSIK